jgi:hypothetical protein
MYKYSVKFTAIFTASINGIITEYCTFKLTIFNYYFVFLNRQIRSKR